MPTNDTEGAALIRAMEEAEAAVRRHVFPRLTVAIFNEDDEMVEMDVQPINTSDPLPDDQRYGLLCPVCDSEVAPDDLSAVDVAERWSSANDDVDFDGQEITFNGEGTGDFGATLYYLHGESHAVSLPHDWSENWT